MIIGRDKCRGRQYCRWRVVPGVRYDSERRLLHRHWCDECGCEVWYPREDEHVREGSS